MGVIHSSSGGSARFDDPLHARIAALIYREAGIVLGPEKVSMMNARLNKRLAATKAGTLGNYVAGIDAGRWPDETAHLISALTTNFTHFFREAHHFDFLRERVFPDSVASTRSLRVWSAGCSSGQEPYSIAITARQAGRRAAVTATDIDQSILTRAERGIFAPSEVASLPPDILRAAFTPCDEGSEICRPVRDMVTFHHLNLHGAWKFDQLFDVIFCRNVIIYFDADAQLRLWHKFRQQLRPGGWLFIGHSERIPDALRDQLRPVGHTIYQHLPN